MRNNPLVARCVRCGHKGDWHLAGSIEDGPNGECSHPECGGHGIRCSGYVLPEFGPYKAIGEDRNQLGQPMVIGPDFGHPFNTHDDARKTAHLLNTAFATWARNNKRLSK